MIPLIVSFMFIQVAGTPLETFRRDAAAIQAGVNESINSSVPGMGLLQSAKATYLDGYGIVVTVEAALEPTRNPFSSPKSSEEVRKIVTERRKTVQEKLEALLKKHTGTLQSIGTAESLTIVLHLFNSNPADLPDLPAQIVMTAKKQDPASITVRKF